MKIETHLDSISIFLHPTEAIWLLNSLQHLVDSYETPFDELSEKEKNYWKGSLTDPNHPEQTLKNESESLELARLEWRGLRHDKTVEWLQQFEPLDPQKEFEFKLLKEEMDLFLQMTNDRRLLLASNHDIGDEDMHHDFEKMQGSPKALPLMEIDFLAFLQGGLLRVMSGDGGENTV